MTRGVQPCTASRAGREVGPPPTERDLAEKRGVNEPVFSHHRPPSAPRALPSSHFFFLSLLTSLYPNLSELPPHSNSSAQMGAGEGEGGEETEYNAPERERNEMDEERDRDGRGVEKRRAPRRGGDQQPARCKK